MSVQSNQLEVPFTQADKDKLNTVDTGAEANPAIATKLEAEAGVDNMKMMTPLRVKQAIDALASGGSGSNGLITEDYTNGSGGTLNLRTPVCQDATGDIFSVNPSEETQVKNILGILLVTLADGEMGTVAFSGSLIKDIPNTWPFGSMLYLSKVGTLTANVPDIGSNSFVEGDFVVKCGLVTKNAEDESKYDLKVEIEVVGQL